MPSNYFLRVIATLRHYSQIVSDILSGSIYMAYIYILTFELTFCLAYTLTFFVGILSDTDCGILFDIVIGILFGILSGRRGPLHQHLAI